MFIFFQFMASLLELDKGLLQILSPPFIEPNRVWVGLQNSGIDDNLKVLNHVLVKVTIFKDLLKK